MGQVSLCATLVAALGMSVSSSVSAQFTVQTEACFTEPCIRTACSASCPPGLVLEWISCTAIKWGVPNAAGDLASSAGFTTNLAQLPADGGEFLVGTLSFTNGVTRIGTELTSIRLQLAATVTNLVPPVRVDLLDRAVCIITTPNVTGDALMDGDIYILPGISSAFDVGLRVAENAVGSIKVYGQVVIEVGPSGRVEFRIELSRYGEPEGASEFVSVRPLSMDALPGDVQNKIDLYERCDLKGMDTFPVALTGSPEADVSMIDLSTVQLSIGNTYSLDPLGVALVDVASPRQSEDPCEREERTPDGTMDLRLEFDLATFAQMVYLLGTERRESTTLSVRGQFMDGSFFQASDCVWVGRVGACPKGQLQTLGLQPGLPR